MKTRRDENNSHVELASLYPDLSEKELAEVALNLSCYVDVVCRIYERNKNLTGLDRTATI